MINVWTVQSHPSKLNLPIASGRNQQTASPRRISVRNTELKRDSSTTSEKQKHEKQKSEKHIVRQKREREKKIREPVSSCSPAHSMRIDTQTYARNSR